MRSHIVLASILLLGFISPAFAQNGTTLEAIKAAAEAGNPAAQDQLAEKYILRTDMKQAEVWYRKAAAQGYAHAQGKLAEMLLNRARMSVGLKPEIKSALGDEGVKWAVLAANQADELGQAKLAEAYAEGKFIKQDWMQVYKWGELAARNPGSMFNPAGVLAGSLRNSAILKLSDDQLAEAKNLVAEFSPHQTATGELPVPAWVKQIKLSGLSGPTNHRLAIINNETFSAGEDNDLKLTGKMVNVKCVEIRDKSALVKIQGIDQLCELSLSE
jgi:hypothetical protein